MGPHAQWSYGHRGRLGHSGNRGTVGHSGSAWVCWGTQAPTGTQVHRHPRPHRGGAPWAAQRHPAGLQDHTYTRPKGAQAQTRSHRDTEPQRYTATETQSHRDTGTQGYRDTGAQRHRGHSDTEGTETQRHRDTETQRHRDTHRHWERGGVSILCHGHLDGA